LPYVQRLAQPDWAQVDSLYKGINVQAGQIIHPALLD